MKRIGTRALRLALADATAHSGNRSSWKARGHRVMLDGRPVVVAECHGEGGGWPVAALIALAPDLAAEVLELRKEVARMKGYAVGAD